MSIPALIHQTWKEGTVPCQFLQWSDSWKQHHPNWEYMLWTDERNREFVRKHYPGFLDKYDAYPSDIQRVDAVRYLILYKMGGVFVDLDVECLKNIAPLLKDAHCVFGEEPYDHCLWHGKEHIISNAFMASEPGDNFLRELISELYNYNGKTDHRFNQVLESTGPFMLSRVYSRYPQKKAVRVLGYEVLYPLTKTQLNVIDCHLEEVRLQLSQGPAYAIHYYYGTWWKNKN